MADKTENTKNRLTGMLLSKSRRAQYVRLFAVLAACVAVVVVVVLHQNGIAMTHKEQVLTCPVSGVVAHTHNESCYDADGNLVCVLPERELHTHTDGCYTETRELTCGLEESEEHKHSDACYTITRELTCGKEEVTEEHVHGPGCFTTVEVEDEAGTAEVEEKPAVQTSQPQAMPAQQFDEDILDDKGNLWVHVSVKAPEGAFPEGTVMRIAPLDAEALRTKVEDALKKENENVTGAREMKAVDIKFIDVEGNEIEPAVQVEVKITSDTVRDLEKPVLVHVDKDENKDAEVLKKVDVVNKDEEDKTEETKDTLKFESNTFSPYVIAEPVTISANVITASGEAYQITVSYGVDAAIPTDAQLEVSEVKKDAEGYDEYAAQTAKALNTGEDTFSHIRMFDIVIKDSYGNKIEPAAPVEVQINYKGNGIEKEQELKVVHLADAGTEVIEPTTQGSGETVDELSFTAKSFSIYSIVSWKETQDLNGKSFAIVQLSTNPIEKTEIENKTRYLGRALQSVSRNGQNKELKAANVAAEEHESGEYLVTTNKSGTLGENLASADAITQWTFEATGTANWYYIKSGDKYLHIGNDGSLSISTDKQSIRVEAENGQIRLGIGNNNNKKYVRSNVSRGTSNNNGDDPYFNSGGKNDDYDLLTLCQIEEVVDNNYPAYTGTKIGANELTDGQSLIIYQTVYNEAKGAYEDYVIDGNGKAVKAYDRGNEVTLYSQTCPVWIVSVLTDGNGQETGYYLFKNEETKKILHPLADNTLVKVPDGNSTTADGVALAGKKQGEYTSTIEYWDQSVNKWVGYQFVNGNMGIELAPGMDDNSQKFSFAVRKTNDGNPLHTVSTVDSKSQGINIHMFDYGERKDIASVTGSDGYTVAKLPDVHVYSKLENGYPKFTNGKSGSQLFTPNNTNGYYKGDANNLFLTSVYNSTGYYEYSSFNNFAKYDQSTGNFTLYAEQGTPYPTNANFYDRRGNFFPYNSLNTVDATRGQSLYNGDGKLLDYENPARGGTLYGISSLNHYFGMTMDFSFLMPKDGKIDDNPVIYEFNGDDDLWVYVDDVLLLDIGGVHDSWSGTINFETGQITYGHDQQGRTNKMPTTIKECFQKAGVFPDGTGWDNNKVDQYFSGNTFKDYGSHKFNMFYMEHGANCSTLETRFNLPVIEKGKVVVAKELSNTSQTDYANVSFAYQLFTKDGNNSIPVNSDATKTDAHGNTTDLSFSNNVKFNGSDTVYNNVFYLKPGEKATFSGIPENQDYYVQEIGINNNYYDEIYVNDVKIEGVTVEGQNGVYASSAATPRNRAQVTFSNHCDPRNTNELRITKRLAPGSRADGDTFEFRVMLENADGVLDDYYQGKYYIKDDSGNYYRFENNQLVNNGQTKYELKAGNKGTIAGIPADFTVVIEDLVAGTDYYVDEIRVHEADENVDKLIGNSSWTLESRELVDDEANGIGYDAPEITNAQIHDYATDSDKRGSALGRIAWNKDAQVVFTNKLNALDVKLQKVDNQNQPLNGAKFDLTKKNGQVWQAYVSNIEPTGENATVDIRSLRPGVYRLEETVTPKGYNILENKYVYFKVYQENGKYKVSLTNEAGDITNNEFAGISESNGTFLLKVKNTPGEELPQTGGAGTIAIYAMGAGLVVIATLGLASKKMRNNL